MQPDAVASPTAAEPESPSAPEPQPAPLRKESSATLNPQPEEVLVINVLARDNNGFNGADLLEVLLACV